MWKILFIAVSVTFICNIGSFAQSSIRQNDRGSEGPVLVNRNVITTNHIDLYPNPAVDYLNIKIENSDLVNIQFELYSIIGNKMDIKLEEVNKNSYKISMKEFNPGYYLLVIKDPIKRYNKSFKFQKQ